MNLRYQALILITASIILFAINSIAEALNYSITSYVVTSIIVLVLVFTGISYFHIRKIESLNQKLKNMLFLNKLEVIDVKGKDEVSSIIKYINRLIKTINVSREELEQTVDQRTDELRKKNIQLQQSISERLAAERRITATKEPFSKLAHYDALTTLPNRIFFNEFLNKTLNHAKRHKKICSILIIDLDNFKHINSKYGQLTGDHVLKEIAQRFSVAIRSDDIIAKLDGDEFIILLTDIQKPKFASSVADKLLKTCFQTIKYDNEEFNITASIGISIFPNDGSSLEDLLKTADTALTKAKQMGGATYQFYTHEINQEAHEFIKTDQALRNAISNNELVLYYQPKLNLKSGSISGLECLLRWIHPTLGIINPAKFIPIAEDTGLINEIGQWTLLEACRTNKHWQDEGYEHVSVAVNLSPKQFAHPDIAEIISNALIETGLNPRYLEIEINEETIMDNIANAAKILDKIKATGVQISIDHFGIGYTSISHLKKFPITSIKIDRYYIKGVPNTPNDVAITNAFIALAHNLGLEVIAEGVETAEQVQYLSLQNCDVVQGYFLSHPLPAAKILGQLSKLRDDVLM